MAKSYPKWVQASDTVSNPYMGSEMATCGVAHRGQNSAGSQSESYDLEDLIHLAARGWRIPDRSDRSFPSLPVSNVCLF